MTHLLRLRARGGDTTVELPPYIAGAIAARIAPFLLGPRVQLLPTHDGVVIALDLVTPGGDRVWGLHAVRCAPGRWNPPHPLRGTVGQLRHALERGIEDDGGEVLDMAALVAVVDEMRRETRRTA